jgi:ADP-ribosylglycohydrolase
LVDLLQGLDLRTSVKKAGMAVGVDVAAMSKTEDPMTACYIDSSFIAMLHFAYKYYDDPRKALLAGANAGGENVNRNALLGAVMGAAHGFDRIDKSLIMGLGDWEGIEGDVNAFLKSLE